nr:hypothetical protein [Acinetobacter baumannii]
MTQRFAFSTSKTLLAVAIFTSMTTSHAEEPAEQRWIRKFEQLL